MKKTGKALLAVIATFIGIVLVVIAFVFVWAGTVVNQGTVTDSLPTVSSDFVPEIRFVVFSDSHNRNERVGEMLDKVYSLYDNEPVYRGIDLICSLGDFSSVGEEKDYDDFVLTLNEHIRPETKSLVILGNHEVKNERALEYFEQKFGYAPDSAVEVNGFRFIALSSYPHITEWTYPTSSIQWLQSEIEKAEQETTSPVFVLQHPHPFGTVYGSTVWCSPQINPVLAGHNRLVDFSGHSHYPMNDPRSINQTSYTAIGCGTMGYFEVDKNLLVGQHPAQNDTASQFMVVEATRQGAVHIIGYDLTSDAPLIEYFIENVNDTSSYAYTYKNMKAHDSNPVFAEKTAVTLTRTADNEFTLTFDEAKDNFIVHHYNVKIKNDKGFTVYRSTCLNPYYLRPEDGKASFVLSSAKLKQGKTYTVTIEAVNAYYQTTTLTTTVQGQ